MQASLVAQLRVSHVGICVSDWKRSLRFYHDVLGFRYVHELELSGEPASTLLQLEDLDFRAITLEREGLRIELLHYERPGHVCGQIPRPMNQLGLTHLSLRADDLDATVSELEEAGVDIREPTRIDVPEANARAVFITDPDGTLIELVQRPGD
jgi:catechol 2,3-dioxygenase-like lactoylglutathione lyase family enzyme